MRSKDGRETWRRLLDWDRGQAPSERLAGQILRMEGFESIDPSHPLGGRDGLKDILCVRGENRWIGAAYFPRGQQPFAAIATKLTDDLKGATENAVDGLAFVTNQELTLAERETLKKSGNPYSVEVFHLERIASILDSPPCYGIRLDFLDIDMTKEEQLAFVAQWNLVLSEMKQTLDAVVDSLTEKRRSKANAEMPIVRPRNLGYSPYSISGLSIPQPHECKSCHEICLVDRSESMTTAATTIGGMTVITCPFCGHSERFNAWHL